ncbi:MAG TPA: nuclear transport factor 2 family protein [Acidimicrobiia bacterium]
MSTNQERTTDTERRRETFTRYFEEAEPRLRVALGAALGQDRGRDATSEALAFGWENWDRLEQMENPIGYLYRVGRSIGPEAAAHWERVFGETGERLTEPYETEPGSFAFVVRYLLPGGGSSTMVHEIEMTGDTVARIGDRQGAMDERVAEREVDRLFEAFNNQDVEALSAFFGDDVVYTSPSNVEFVGQQAATYWQRSLGRQRCARPGSSTSETEPTDSTSTSSNRTPAGRPTELR